MDFNAANPSNSLKLKTIFVIILVMDLTHEIGLNFVAMNGENHFCFLFIFGGMGELRCRSLQCYCILRGLSM